MILKELNLISFGKFNNRKIGLDHGLNIIYGENESGKTTIHNFIEGMFYGFLRPYARRRYFLPELDKYRPWHGEKYYGIITLQEETKSYKIERDFNRGYVRIYDELTGKDITDDIDLGEKLNIHLPGLYFFDFNSIIYRNTISIKQLGNKIESDLAGEIKDKLANITTSLDDEISVKNAMADLDKRLDSIGTERAYKKPYGRAVKELDQLKEKRKEALQKKEEYEQTKERFLQLKDEIESKEVEINIFRSKLEKAKICQLKKAYEEAKRIEGEIHSLNEEIENLKNYSKLCERDYYEAFKLDNQVKVLDNEINGLIDRLRSIDTKLADLNRKYDVEEDKDKVQGLYEDYSHYNQLEDEKNSLLINHMQNKLEIANVQLRGIREKKKKSTIQSIAFSFILLASLGLSTLNVYFLILAALSLMLLAYSFYKSRSLNKEVSSLGGSILELRQKEQEREDRIEKITELQKHILEKHKCSTKVEFTRLYEEVRFLQTNANLRLREIEGLKGEKEEVERLINKKQGKKEEFMYALKSLLNNNQVNSLDHFKEGLGRKRIYDNLIKDRESKAELLDHILKNISLEELKEKTVYFKEELKEDIEEVNIDIIEENLSSMEKAFSEMKYEYSKLEERMDILNNHVKELVNIDEEIARKEREIEGFKEYIQSIEIAKEVIGDISERIHKQFAPEINKNVSQLICYVTGGKYGSIKIDDNLDVSVENPTTGELIPIDSLSGGTIDQIHFALRFSIMDSMKKDTFPLILDDCFIQYDDRRLKNMLEFLAKLSERNQIILFTCQNREGQLLDSMNLTYNFIDIS